MFMILTAPERRKVLAQAITDNRMRAGHSTLIAPRPPVDLPASVECLLVPDSLDDVAAAARADNGIIIATPELARQSGAERPERGVAIVLLGHSDPQRPSRLTPIAKARLDVAKRLALQLAPRLRAVVLSGRGPDGQTPEADQYAWDWQGERLPLLREIASMTTRENADEAVKLLRALGGVDEVILVTSRWHTGRALWLMRDASTRAGASWKIEAHSSWLPLAGPARFLKERRYLAHERSR
jgi:hypothetical protein